LLQGWKERLVGQSVARNLLHGSSNEQKLYQKLGHGLVGKKTPAEQTNRRIVILVAFDLHLPF
jgi:hypothetical protein